MAFSAGAGANLGSASGEIRIDTAAAERSLKQLQGSVGTFASTTESSFQRIATGVGLLAVSKGIFSAFGVGINSARDFEQAIANVNAVTDLTAEQLDQVSKAAQRLGAESVFSATEAANAMEELAKAGVSVEDILNGAADGAVALAASAGIGLPQAATIIATAMNTFGLAGDQATHVADVFSAASNKSAADADGLAQSLQQVGLVAASNNITLEETTGILALLADNGLKGSDAGTALKTAIQSLLTPMGRGADAMLQYGINVRDASGNFIGFAATADELHRALDPLPKAQRDAALAAIFGTDAIRVGNVLWREGGDAITEYTTAVDDSGAASETAAKRLDTMNGALEQLRGAMESASIIIGKKFLPAMKEVVQAATAMVQAFIALPGPVQTVLAGLVGAAGVIAGIAGVMVLAGPKLAAFGEALKVIRATLIGFAAANPILLAAIAAIALFGVAYTTNFGGFADAVDGAIAKVREFGKVFARAFAFSRSLPEIGNLGAAFAAVGQAMTEVLGINVYKQFRLIGKVADRIGMSLNRMARQFGILSRAIKRGGLAEGFDQLFGKVGRNLLAEFGDAIGALPRTIGTAFRQITTGIKPVDTALHNLGSGFIQFGRAVENVFAGNVDTAIKNLQNAGNRFKAIGIQLGTIAIAGVPVLVGVLADLAADAWKWVTGNFRNILNFAFSLGELAISGVVKLAGTLKDLAVDVWDWVFGNFHNVVNATKTLGTLLIDGTVELEETLGNFARDVWGFIIATFQNIGDAAQTLGTLTIDGAVALGEVLGEVIPDVWGWIKDNAENTLNNSLALGTLFLTGTVEFVSSDDFSVTAEGIGQGIVDAIVSLGTLANDIGTAIADKVTSIDWLGFATSGAFGSGESFGAALRQLIISGAKALGQIDASDVADVFLKVGEALFKASLAFPAATALVATAIVSFIAGAIKGLVFGEGDIDWSGVLNGIVTTFTNALDSVRDRIVGALQNLFGGGTQLDVKRGLGGGKLITTEVEGLFSNLDFSSLAGDLAQGIIDGITGLVTFGSGIVQAMLDGISGALSPSTFTNLAATIASSIWDGIKQWFTDNANPADLVPGAGGADPNSGTANDNKGIDVPDEAKPKKQNFIAMGVPLGEGLVDGIVLGINNKSADVQAALRNLATGKGGGVAGAGSALKGLAEDAPAAIKIPEPDLSGLLKGLAEAEKATTSSTRNITEVAGDIVRPLAAAGQQAAQSFANGISAGMRIAIGAAATGAQQVVNAARANLSTLGPAGFGVGQSLGFGIANGISSTVGSVINAAVSLVFAAVNAAKFAAQIASPSKLFAKQVGLPIAQGMAVGISDGTNTVQRSIGQLIGASIPTTSTASMVGAQPVGAVRTSVGTTVNVFTIPPDDWVRFAGMAERGHNAETTWENLPRSHNLVFGR